MGYLTEPVEIERFDLPYNSPLSPIDGGNACIPHGFQPVQVEPDDLSVIQRILYDTSPDDYHWTSQQFENVPAYLTKYFATRYTRIFEKEGRKVANTFINKKLMPAKQRVLLVLKQYKRLPTTQKIALFSEELSSTKQSDLDVQHPQMGFDFEQAEKTRKPVKSRILAELESDEVKEMAFKIGKIVIAKVQHIGDQLAKLDVDAINEQRTENDPFILEVEGYEKLAQFAQQFGVKIPRKYVQQTAISAAQDVSKLIDEKWWFGRLWAIRKIMREHLAIAMGQVSAKASPYASWNCIREHQEQQKRNYEFMKQSELFDEETEEVVGMWDTVKKSISNPAIRRHELMARCRGCEDIGNELGLQGLFLTLTAPSKYHSSYKKGGFINHWNGASPKETQAYLNNIWQRIRAKLGRKGIRWFGVRVAEPHHDGTPHWHMLIWVKPTDALQVTDIFIRYAVLFDKEELTQAKPCLPFDAINYVEEREFSNPFRVYKKIYANHFPSSLKQFRPEVELPESVQLWPINRQGLTTLNIDYQPRCDVGFIDPEKGTATGYIAKYISKNIDGYAMDDDLSDEVDKPVKEMARNVTAWKSRWCIRQYQFFGGAPVTTYRELRRFANQNKKAFMEYLYMQQRVDLLTLYSMLMRDLVGPIKPSRLISKPELMEAIGNSYQARLKTEDEPTVSNTLKAADTGDWMGYIMGQGGPFVKRDDLLITNSYEVLPFASPHGEDVRKIEGFSTPQDTVKTRTKVWTIRKKSTVIDGAEACALGSEATAVGASGSSRSSVNNCTDPQKVQVCDQLIRLFEPKMKKSKAPPNIDESALAALLKGSSLKVDNETSIQIRPAEVDDRGNKRPAQLVEVSRTQADNLSWMDFEGWDETFTQPKEDDYQQPDLSYFPELEGEWPLG
ncbi:replication endonuclease [Vibrio sp. 10N.261.51.F12]|uniref:replication endonuclease n=1 Tax=Vibrio sp. 10N.261.51.F12 TaxID=3229679 RepID=UPI00354C1C64